MFYVAEALIVILVIVIFLQNRQKKVSFQACLPVIAVLAALGILHLSHAALQGEYDRARDVTFSDADHQLTVGVYCTGVRAEDNLLTLSWLMWITQNCTAARWRSAERVNFCAPDRRKAAGVRD